MKHVPYPKEQMFRVTPLRATDEKKARLLEAIVNRPEFVSKTLRATEIFIERFILPEILYGKTFTEQEKDEGMKAIVREVEESNDEP